MNLPPIKCLPLKLFTPNLGRVNEIKYYGVKRFWVSPYSTSQPDGMSTDNIGVFVVFNY